MEEGGWRKERGKAKGEELKAEHPQSPASSFSVPAGSSPACGSWGCLHICSQFAFAAC